MFSQSMDEEEEEISLNTSALDLHEASKSRPYGLTPCLSAHLFIAAISGLSGNVSVTSLADWRSGFNRAGHLSSSLGFLPRISQFLYTASAAGVRGPTPVTRPDLDRKSVV